jgi:hypothetical protein
VALFATAEAAPFSAELLAVLIVELWERSNRRSGCAGGVAAGAGRGSGSPARATKARRATSTVARLLLAILEDEVCTESISSTADVFEIGVVCTIIDALIVVSVELVLKFLQLMFLRKRYVDDAFLEAGTEIFKGLIVLLCDVFELGVRSRLSVTVTIPLGHLVEAFLSGLNFEGSIVRVEASKCLSKTEPESCDTK